MQRSAFSHTAATYNACIHRVGLHPSFVDTPCVMMLMQLCAVWYKVQCRDLMSSHGHMTPADLPPGPEKHIHRFMAKVLAELGKHTSGGMQQDLQVTSSMAIKPADEHAV